MKVFNAKAAAEEYMSTHSLTYSTPDSILTKFAYWLADVVEMDCNLSEEQCKNEDGMHPKHKVPRVMLFIEERDQPYRLSIEEDVFKPTGAITSYFGVKDKIIDEKADTIKEDVKYCHECGSKLSVDAKFCYNCGAKQID